MLRVVCLLALALALAGAAARARPDAALAPTPTHLENIVTNEVSSADASTPAPTSPPTTEPPPLHRQYPHAVLFGGTCGGSIIHEKWVLTAGHCTLFTSGRHVLAGTSATDDGSGVRRRVKKLYLHPLFAVGPYWVNVEQFALKQVHARWDFMLVELESPLPLDGVNLNVVRLDGAPDVAEAQPVDYGGFGAAHHGGVMRNEMHAMKLRTVSDERCSSLPQYSKDDMLCAEGRTATRDSACNGDSGSGLVSADAESRRLLGVASWVEDDAHECSPGKLVVFSRVAAARPWIQQVTGIDFQ